MAVVVVTRFEGGGGEKGGGGCIGGRESDGVDLFTSTMKKNKNIVEKRKGKRHLKIKMSPFSPSIVSSTSRR